MPRVSSLRSPSCIFIGLVLASISLTPLAVEAQMPNICIMADAQCTPDAVADHHPCACVIVPFNPIPGVCVAQNYCQGSPAGILSSIGAWIAANPLTSAGIGIGASTLGSSLLSGGSGGSSGGGTDSVSQTLASLEAPQSGVLAPSFYLSAPQLVSPSGGNDAIAELFAALQPPGTAPAH